MLNMFPQKVTAQKAIKLWRALFMAVLMPFLLAALLHPLRQWINSTDAAMLLLLWTTWVAQQYSKSWASLATLCSVLWLNWFFVPPYFTLQVHNANYLITLAVMMSLGLLIAHLADRLRLQLAKARNSISQMRGMFMLAKGLSRRTEWKAQLVYAERLLSRRLGVNVRFQNSAPTPNPDLHIITLGQSKVFGYLSLHQQSYQQHQTLLNTAQSLLEQTYDKQFIQQRAQQDRLRAELEAERAMMLRSLSHDLRTPLATIMGASSMLADDNVPLTDAQRRQQAENIYQQSKLLNQHFEKVLELSKAQLPQSSLKWQQFAADELMAGALARRGDELQPLLSMVQRQTTADLCGDLTLLEIALANMLENAVRHGTAPFLVNFQHDSSGNFQMRVDNQAKASSDKGRDAGNGLGVNICRTIAGLHGGKFELHIGTDGCHALFTWRQANAG